MNEEIKTKLWPEVEKYLNLEIGGKQITAPYYTNYVGSKTLGALLEYGLSEEETRKVFKIYNSNQDLYGLYRGKGTAQELGMGIEKIAGVKKINLKEASEKGILMLMYDFGLGVDCSGFVYNVLYSVWGQKLIDILDWGQDTRRDVFRAGAFTFAGKASELIDIQEVVSGDLILLKKDNKYSHVALVLEKDEFKFVAQSTSCLWPMGVHVNKLEVVGGEPKLGFKLEWGKRWEEKWRLGELEFRRLKFMR